MLPDGEDSSRPFPSTFHAESGEHAIDHLHVTLQLHRYQILQTGILRAWLLHTRDSGEGKKKKKLPRKAVTYVLKTHPRSSRGVNKQTPLRGGIRAAVKDSKRGPRWTCWEVCGWTRCRRGPGQFTVSVGCLAAVSMIPRVWEVTSAKRQSVHLGRAKRFFSFFSFLFFFFWIDLVSKFFAKKKWSAVLAK